MSPNQDLHGLTHLLRAQRKAEEDENVARIKASWDGHDHAAKVVREECKKTFWLRRFSKPLRILPGQTSFVFGGRTSSPRIIITGSSISLMNTKYFHVRREEISEALADCESDKWNFESRHGGTIRTNNNHVEERLIRYFLSIIILELESRRKNFWIFVLSFMLVSILPITLFSMANF